MELKQTLKLTQHLAMTPQLQQAIKLLQLSRLELLDTIKQEMNENPVLEEEAEPKEENIKERNLEEELASAPGPEKVEGDIGSLDFNWENYLREDSENFSNEWGLAAGEKEQGDQEAWESNATKGITLTVHLLGQLSISDFTEKEKELSALIIGNLDENGYLQTAVEEIARVAGEKNEFVEKVLKKTQHFDPSGIAARDLKECLLIQIRRLDDKNSKAEEILLHHLHNLEKRNFLIIARDLKISLEEMIKAAEIISSLNPTPGKFFDQNQVQYIVPDIFIYKRGNDYEVVLNEDGLPKLKVSSFYRKSLSSNNLSDFTKEYIHKKLRSAVWLIKSIYQRQQTVLKVTKSIIEFQRDFFDRGTGYLKPLVLKDIAENIGMHESTVSRVTSNKYVYTSHGIFPMKYFFGSSIGLDNGDNIASESVKEKIQQIILSEEKHSSYSDKKIAELLEKKGICIARRTVAKYREMMGIPPSSRRKKGGGLKDSLKKLSSTH